MKEWFKKLDWFPLFLYIAFGALMPSEHMHWTEIALLWAVFVAIDVRSAHTAYRRGLRRGVEIYRQVQGENK